MTRSIEIRPGSTVIQADHVLPAPVMVVQFSISPTCPGRGASARDLRHEGILSFRSPNRVERTVEPCT
ncbi:MAG: hypothetical protein P8J45_05490 [Phycisphaerales bacterium]|nr:hypothetical protein [Phycisphaerales bacterium]